MDEIHKNGQKGPFIIFGRRHCVKTGRHRGFGVHLKAVAPLVPRSSKKSMKPGLQVGHVGKLSRIVDASQTITLGDEAAATVFSTPSMIDLMEHAARAAL